MKIAEVQNQIKVSNTNNVQTNNKTGKDPKLEQSAKDLEAIFISFVLKTMEKSMSLDPENNSNNMAQMMFSSVMSEEIAENGGIGLSDFIYKSLAAKDQSSLLDIKKQHNINYLNIISNFRSSDE